MNDQERDELLIRVDERVDALHCWSIEHKDKHKEERANTTKWLVAIFSLMGE